MNIFYLDHDISNCVQYHNDAHASKMILESTQLLSSCTRILDGVEVEFYNPQVNKTQKFNILPGETIKWYTGEELRDLWDQQKVIGPLRGYYDYDLKRPEYKVGHRNHPDAIWLRKSKDHWLWLQQFVASLNEEQRFRKHNSDPEWSHKSALTAAMLKPPINLESNGFTPPPACMPDTCKTDDIVQSYRNYYCQEKQHLASWTNRPVPDWYQLGDVR